MTAWTGDTDYSEVTAPESPYRPHLACASLLEQMAHAQEGLSLLRTYLKDVPDDAVAWAVLAEASLEQQVYWDGVATLMGEDDVAPSVDVLREDDNFEPEQPIDALVGFASAGMSLFDEGSAALAQALTHAATAPFAVRLYVRGTLIAYVDALEEIEAIYERQPQQPLDVAAVVRQFEARFDVWAQSPLEDDEDICDDTHAGDEDTTS